MPRASSIRTIPINPEDIQGLKNRLWRDEIKVNPDTECWEWQGKFISSGYGYIQINRSSFLAHRISYLLFTNADISRLHVCHDCDNPKCVNPRHLFSGSQAENMRDMKLKGRASKLPKAIGEKNGLCKLTEEKVKEIRIKYASGNYTMMQLGPEYGVDWSNISCIVRRKTWKHVV